MWLGGLEAVTHGLRDSGNLNRNPAYSLQSQHRVSARFNRRLCTILSIVLTTLDVRLTSRRFVCSFQREDVVFLPDSRSNTFGEVLIEVE